MLVVIHDDALLAVLYDIAKVEVIECASHFCRRCVYALKHIVELLLETPSTAKRLPSVTLAVLLTLELVKTLACFELLRGQCRIDVLFWLQRSHKVILDKDVHIDAKTTEVLQTFISGEKILNLWTCCCLCHIIISFCVVECVV